MTITYATITGPVLTPDGGTGVRARVEFLPQTADNIIAFPGEGLTQGPVTVFSGADGEFETDAQIPTSGPASGVVWQVTVTPLDRGPSGKLPTWSRLYEITASGSLDSLVETEPLAVTPEFVADLEAIRDDASDFADDAEGAALTAAEHRTAVEAVVATNDGIMASVAADPDSDFAAVQSATYVGKAADGSLVPLDTPATVREGAGAVLFDAALTANGNLSAYNVQYPQFASVVNDPILGAARKVAKLDVPDDGTLYPSQPWPDNKARCQLESPAIVAEHDEVYVGFSQLLPASFPVVPEDPADGWLGLGEFNGPPFGGATGNGPGPILDVYRWHYSDVDLSVERDVWVDVIIRCRMEDEPGGFFEMWTCSGEAWEQRTFTLWADHGGDGTPSYRRVKSVFQPGINNGGWNFHKLSNYRSLGTWPEVIVYFADHRIGTTWDSVKPGSYPDAALPWEM